MFQHEGVIRDHQTTDDLREPPQGGPAAAQPPDLTNSLLMSGEVVEVHPVVSRSVLDPIGGARRRGEYRARLVQFVAAQEGRRVVMMTLTVDRAAHEGPQAARCRMTAKLPDLMRLLLGDGARWQRVLEYQERSGEGWPHFHVVAVLAKGQSLSSFRRRCWALWRDRWCIGGVDVQQVQSRRAAALYLGKYFTKCAKAVPPWVLELERVPRLYGSSWAARVSPGARSALRRVVRSARARDARPRLRVLDRLSVSGTRVRLARLRVDPVSGEVRRQWMRGAVMSCPAHLASDPRLIRDAGPSPGGGMWLRWKRSTEALGRRLQNIYGEAALLVQQSRRCELESRWSDLQGAPDG